MVAPAKTNGTAGPRRLLSSRGLGDAGQQRVQPRERLVADTAALGEDANDWLFAPCNKPC
ncbi:MAG: hypothetical protein KatS3mg077_0551 [Candidatus Binatia bacterium]|nr:MAG: hypothetical protein KatS3mg077_0551 [Candidatus Binatia bacterium]